MLVPRDRRIQGESFFENLVSQNQLMCFSNKVVIWE